MSNLTYSEHIEDVLDRLRNLVHRNLSEQDYLMLTAPQRLAKATSEGLLRVCRELDPAAIPDLFFEKTLTKKRTYKAVNAYDFPNQLFLERSDKGIFGILLDTEEVGWEEATSKLDVEFMANSLMYGPNTHVFAISEVKRKFYAPAGVTFAVQMLQKPHSVHAAEEGSEYGGDLQITSGATSSGDVTISDGTNSITVTLSNGNPAATVATKITDAINAETNFYYDAVYSSGDTLTLKHRQDMPMNQLLDITFTDTGATGATASFTDRGTIDLPIDSTYAYEIAEQTLGQLIEVLTPANNSETKQAKEQQQKQASQ